MSDLTRGRLWRDLLKTCAMDRNRGPGAPEKPLAPRLDPPHLLSRLNLAVPVNNHPAPAVYPPPMRTLILATCCFLTLPLFAQNAPRRPIPATIGAPGLVQNPGAADALDHNITLRLHGTTTTGTDVDLSLCGIGPRFTADQIVNDDTLLTCIYNVSTAGDGYQVTYTVSARLKVATQSGPNSSYEYRDVSISGTILCSLDHPQTLVRNGSKPLQLTITREAEKDGP